MSKRGRRRNSKRRKSSSSSKQCVSPYMFQKNKSNSVSYRDDFVEKGETDAMLKENVQSGSEDEEKYNSAPPKEKRFKEDYHVDWFSHTKNIYTKTTKDEEKGVKIVTSVSVNDLEDSPPSILFQQSREPLCEDPTRSSGPVTNVLRINCSGSHVKLEIQKKHHNDSSGTKTTLVFLNEGGGGAEMFLQSQERTRTPSNEGSEPPANTSPNPDFTFTFGSISPQTEVRTDSQSVSFTNTWDITNSCRCSCQTSGPPALLQRFPPGKRKSFHRSFSIEEFWDIPPPRQFADFKSDTLADLTQDLASCRIGADGQRRELPPTSTQEPEGPFPEPEETADVPPSFDQLSESDNYEPMFMRPSLSTNRSSFTEDFINCQQRRSWIRSNSISTVEHRGCSLSRRRRQTFPGVLRRQEDLLPYSESLSSLIMCTLSFQTERLGSIHQADDSFSLFETGSYTSAQTKGSFNKAASEVPDGRVGQQPLRVSSDRRRRSNRQHSRCEDMDALDVEDQNEVTDSGFDQEMGEVERHSPELPGLAIQVTPPSCSGSEEQMQPSHPGTSSQSSRGRRASDSAQLELSRSSAKTVQGPEQSFPQSDSRLSMCSCPEKHLRGAADPDIPPAEVTEGGHTGTTRSSLLTEDTSPLNVDAGSTGPDNSVRSEVSASSPAKSSPDSGVHGQEPLRKSDQADKHIRSRSSFESMEHLKPVQHKDLEGSSSEHWAKRRKLFKESRQWSSAGGSSITSDNPEESVVEDTHSMDVTVQDSQDRGFYTETFHSSAWIYQGDDAGMAGLRPNLNTRARTVSIRERTVKISKGTGEYPWGFRIQFSKPIVVTEVDTNGAAEEAGLMVGDFVHAVNGIDVTSIPHSEAADLARQGPDVLTLTIGSDIARGPNTPRPACRGYLHKRTQSGLIKGWRKRWFVLTHDCCLYYYRHKRDEGRRRALSALKLEGAEVGSDVSLGKPFVFKCRPQTGNRLFFFSATSNQEMKRWLEAMQKAVHPITQNHVWVDVTRHNSNLPPLAMKSPDCLGLLHKLDKSKDTWLQHYCILKDSCLYLYSGIRATHAHGGIYLQGYLVREQPYASKKSTIELKPLSDEFKTFYFCAENPTENQRWILAIKASVNKWLPLHRALQDYMNRPPEETRM